MTPVPTYTATIYVGLKEGYSGPVHTLDEARILLQEHVDAVGLCVTLTPTEFIYTKGAEPGVIVGLINYPRFPSTPEQIQQQAKELAHKLLRAFGQQRATIVFPDVTITLSREAAQC